MTCVECGIRQRSGTLCRCAPCAREYRRTGGQSWAWRRFWDKVDMAEGCWTWTGAAVNQGYGLVTFQNRYSAVDRSGR